VYLLFTNFFILEHCLGARPFGLDTEASVEAMAKLLSAGLLRRSAR
jgi:hypothetical protein